MRTQDTIELNGKLYNAVTGLPLKPARPAVSAEKTTAKKTVRPQARGGFVDGIRPAPGHKKQVAAAKTAAQPAAKPATVIRIKGTPAKTTLKRSATLNRKSVKQPKLKVAASLKKAAAAEKKPQAAAKITPKVDQKRAERAAAVVRSSRIERFHAEPKAKTAKARAEKKPQAEPATPLTEHLKQTHQPSAKAVPAAQQASAKRAISHHKAKRKKSGRLARYASTTLVVLLLSGYVAYLNVPFISLKVASQRAGFAARMPAAPSGYSLNGPIAYNPGQVVINFKANTDERRFSVKQQPSTWDSIALLENHVLKQTDNYEIYQDRGLTIYVFNGDSAVWVNGGTFYAVNGHSSNLTATQLLEIAGSM